MKTSHLFIILLLMGNIVFSCTPQETLDNRADAEIVGTGDDDDISPDNDKDG